MSRNTRTMSCTPEDVFDILTDGWSYATWVVGAARIRDVDPQWPAPGSRVHHSVGMWPMLISDDSEVERIDAPREIQLRVRAWPSGEGRVLLSCTREGSQTNVTIEERAVSGPAKLIPVALQNAMLRRRNNESLRRLAYLAESRARRNANDDGSGSVAKTRDHGQ